MTDTGIYLSASKARYSQLRHCKRAWITTHFLSAILVFRETDERDSLSALEGEWTFRSLFQTPPFVFAQMLWLRRNTWWRRAVCLVERSQKAKVTQATMWCCACLVYYFDYLLIYYYYYKLVNTVCNSLHFHFLGDFWGWGVVYMIHLLFENTGSFMMHSWRSNVQRERDKSVQMVRAVLLLLIIITCLWASLYVPLSTVTHVRQVSVHVPRAQVETRH